MRAAIFRKGEIVVGEIAEPKPGPGQVLVKTLACGICGTDLHARVHADKMIEMSKYLPWRKPMDLSRDEMGRRVDLDGPTMRLYLRAGLVIHPSHATAWHRRMSRFFFRTLGHHRLGGDQETRD
jgi:threonine dehydrogenase-like Zn-dependent dehydrogenase